MIEYVEVKQTPLQSLHTTYEFLCADLEEGLVYSVSENVITQAKAAILVHLKEEPILDGTNSRTFCESVYPYLRRIERTKSKYVLL